MNNQIEAYKQQILDNIQHLEKLCTEYLPIAENTPEDELIVYSLGDQPIYDAIFYSVGEYFYSQITEDAKNQ